MSTRTIYVKNEAIWELLRDYADLTEKSMSALVEDAIDEYLAAHAKNHQEELLTNILVKAGYVLPQARDIACRILYDKKKENKR